MDAFIKDGTGRGHEAEVDVYNRLSVKARQLNPMHLEALYSKKAYVLTPILGRYTLPNTGDRYLFFIKNNGSDLLVMDSIQVVVSGETEWWYASGAPYTTLGGVTAITPRSLYIGEKKTPDITAYCWDGSTGTGITGFSAGGYFWEPHYIPIAGVIEDRFNGGLILPPQTDLIFWGSGFSSGYYYNFRLKFYMLDAEDI